MSEVAHFGVWDYVVFSVMLLFSALIGVYSALSGGRQKTADEFLLGNRNMNIIPVALSIMVSFVSAITVIGTPGEVYIYNTMLMWNIVMKAIGDAFGCRLFVPLYFKLQVTSLYEYLELRFNRAVRLCGTFIFAIYTFLYMGIVTYTPALAISAVTGIGLDISIIATGAVCVFYTTVGGIKAVLWTDTLQSLVMLIGVLAVIIKGTMEVGGLGEVWQRSIEGQRLELLDWSFNPTVRYTVWGMLVGLGFTNLSMIGTNQTIVQRILSVGTKQRAYQAIFLSVIAHTVIAFLCYTSGLVMYAYYQDCDPYTAGYVEKTDQLMPYLVMDLFANMPGLPGLFVSAVISASMSTISSGVNSLAAVTGEDVIKVIWPQIKPQTYTWTIKSLAALYGILTIGLAFLVKFFGSGVLQLSISLSGITGGGILGVFLLGIYVHRSNSKGAICGLISSVLFVGWMKLGSMAYPTEQDKNELSVEGCLAENVSSTMATGTDMTKYTTSAVADDPSASWPPIADFYAVSFVYYTPIGVAIAMGVGTLISALTGFDDPKALNPKLKHNFTDALCCCFPESCKKVTRCGVEKSSLTDEAKTDIEFKIMQEGNNGHEDGREVTKESELTSQTESKYTQIELS